MTHILTIDIGNTSVCFGYFHENRLKKTYRLKTQDLRVRDIVKLKKIFPVRKIRTTLLASVVPQATQILKKTLLKKWKLDTLEVGKDLPVPIKNLYKNPKQVGIDRLINALAGFHRFKKELIIIDFGTAITFDVVSKKGEYLGGAIAPGIEISLEALYQKTALLPKIQLAHPQHVIGHNTIESIRSGCTYGIAGLCERIVYEIEKQHHIKPLIIATGGYAHFIGKYLQIIDHVDPELMLKGIFLAYRLSQENQKKIA